MNSLGTAPPDTGRARKLAAYLDGFSLHAAVHLHANDREGLTHLCGYGARPPLSQERLRRAPGRVHRFTVGQRRGLGVTRPLPLYVAALDVERQRVVVGTRD